VRLDVSADGTYARSVVGRKQAACGNYRVQGTSLLLVDESRDAPDTGYERDGTPSVQWAFSGGVPVVKI
jgi:hypothetical protein